jgi:hypothetical protein
MTLESLIYECRTSENLIVKLEAIRDKPDQSNANRRRASFYITEVLEDVIDHGSHFNITEEYLGEITPPPHQGHQLETD